jgi:geranylgeranyl pyrophosphate synthase
MLTEAFATLSPQLAARYQAVLTRALVGSPELAALHAHYLDYTRLDAKLPRPVLAYFGYHATTQDVSFSDLDTIGDGLLIAQLVRDFLAIHDDIVDEDLDKFGAAPLPVRLSGQEVRNLTQHGKDLVLYYGDFLIGVIFQLAANTATHAPAITRLIGDTLYVTQRGQLAELLAEERPLCDTSVEDVLLIGERKAAYYCYAFPFALGATLAGHPPDVIDPVVSVLLAIGTLSQVVDDLTGAFPGVIDNDKDTLGEIANLRRTLPLVLLAHNTAQAEIIELLSGPAPLDDHDARRLREYLWKSEAPRLALTICQDNLAQIQHRLSTLPIGTTTANYLDDLVQHRLATNINYLRAALSPRTVQ